MEQRNFNLTMATLVGLLLLSSSPLGAMLGLFLGFAVAMFVAPMLWMLASALGTDLNTIMRPTLITVGVLYLTYGLFMVGLTASALRKGDMRAARLNMATLAFVAVIPLILYLSSEALVDAWP